MIRSDAYVSGKSIVDVLTELSQRGWEASFGVAEEGCIRAPEGHIVRPGHVQVDEIFRFEGASDPADETLVLAITVDDGERQRGTLVVAYGPRMTPDEVALVDALEASAPVR